MRLLRSPLQTLPDFAAAAVKNPELVLRLRFDDSAPVVCVVLLCTWLVWSPHLAGYLAIFTLCVACSAERVVRKRVDAAKEHDKPGPEYRPKEQLVAAATQLGQNPVDDDGIEILRASGKTSASLKITMLGQAVRYYTRDKSRVVYGLDKAYIPSCGAHTFPPEDAQVEDVLGNVFVGGDYTAGRPVIPHATPQEAQTICDSARLSTRMLVKLAVYREMSFTTAQALWAQHTGPVVWDIPCSAHPALETVGCYPPLSSLPMHPLV
jgi:hypothetical protein